MKRKTLFGYEVRKTNFHNSMGELVEYVLTGKRETKYQLIRHGGGKKTFFIRNPAGNIVGLKGNYTIEEDWVKG